ncbi:MAG: O-antigen ligase family protein [Oscillospiraceae bacterium]|nr:O-antigen ligase family protein [Oscillospiraceae bacterium]
MKKIFFGFGRVVFNAFYFKIVLLLLSLGTVLVPLAGVSYRLLYIALVWGAVLCLQDLLTRRRFLAGRRSILLLGFLAVFLVSVLLNRHNAFNLNFAGWAYAVFSLLVLYPDRIGGDRERAVREMSVLGNLYIGVTAILSTVSFYMFIIQYADVHRSEAGNYIIGWFENRLFGMYANPGLMMSVICIAVILIQWELNRLKYPKTPWYSRLFWGYALAVNFFCMALENAYAAYISFGLFVAVTVFFKLRRTAALKPRPDSKRRGAVILPAVLAAAAVAAVAGMIYGSRQVLPYLPALYTYSKESASQPESSDTGPAEDNGGVSGTLEIPENTEAPQLQENAEIPASPAPAEESKLDHVEIDRFPNDRDFLHGRMAIWKFGAEKFLEKPLFGHGPDSFRDYTGLTKIGLRHFHNLIVHTLVAVGAFGAVFIFTFLFLSFWEPLRRIWKQQAAERYGGVILAVFAFLAMLAVNGMSEVTVLFLVRPSMFMFWYYLGYLTVLTNDSRPSVFDRPAKALAAGMDKVLRRKRETG